MEFASPKILWFLLLLLPLVGYYIYRTRQGGASVVVSTTETVRRAPRTFRYYLRHIPFVLRCAALSLIVVAIARPQSAEHYTNTTTEGIDIVLAVDVSTSMLAKDFIPDRLSVAKEVASEEAAASAKPSPISAPYQKGKNYPQSKSNKKKKKK